MQYELVPWYNYFYLGILFFQLVFIIYQYYIYRRVEFVYYLCYIFFVSVYHIFSTTTYFNPIKFTITNHNHFVIDRGIAFLCFYFYFKFGEHFCNMDTLYTNVTRVLRKVQKIILVIAIVDIVTASIAQKYVIYEPLFFFITIMLVLYSLYLIIFLVKQKDVFANILVLGTLFLLTGTTFSILHMKIAGLNHSETIWLSFIGVVVEFLFLNFGLILKSKFTHERDVNNTLISQQEIYKERDRITADLHDEIGGGLSTIRILSDIHKNVNDVETHKKFAEKIAEVSEDISNKMRTIIWALKPENDELVSFVQYVNEYAKSIFDNTSIQYLFKENIEYNRVIHLSNTIRKNLFLCVKEALTNVLKHADATSVTIDITFSNNNQIAINIIDNGKGIKSTNHLGNGMRIMEKRMKEIGGNFSYSTIENQTQLLFVTTI